MFSEVTWATLIRKVLATSRGDQLASHVGNACKRARSDSAQTAQANEQQAIERAPKKPVCADKRRHKSWPRALCKNKLKKHTVVVQSGMSPADEYSGALVPQRVEFNTTHWSVVLAVRGESAAAQEALEKLCRVYWYPLYAFVRRQGHSAEDAEDIIQGFFARLLQRKDLETVQHERGRFQFPLAGCRRSRCCEARPQEADQALSQDGIR